MSDTERIDENTNDVLRRESARLDGTLAICAVLLCVIAGLEAAQVVIALVGLP